MIYVNTVLFHYICMTSFKHFDFYFEFIIIYFVQFWPLNSSIHKSWWWLCSSQFSQKMFIGFKLLINQLTIFMIDQFVFWWFTTWSVLYIDCQHAQTSSWSIHQWSSSFINLQLVLVLVLALTWDCWCCFDSLHPAGGASSLCTDQRTQSGGPERRTETRMSSEQCSGTRNQDQDCLQMVHIPAGLRGAPENHRNVLSSRLPANINSPATRLHRVLKDAFTRLRADCRHELNLGRVQTVTEHFWRRSVNQTGVVLWSFWSELCGRHRNALTSGDRSIR